MSAKASDRYVNDLLFTDSEYERRMSSPGHTDLLDYETNSVYNCGASVIGNVHPCRADWRNRSAGLPARAAYEKSWQAILSDALPRQGGGFALLSDSVSDELDVYPGDYSTYGPRLFVEYLMREQAEHVDITCGPIVQNPNSSGWIRAWLVSPTPNSVLNKGTERPIYATADEAKGMADDYDGYGEGDDYYDEDYDEEEY